MDNAIAGRAPSSHAPGRTNPYVGPRPLQPSDTLYGRARELNELGDLLLAERIVLLYSPSGAGKTSLINAGLSKRLREQERFRVLPPLRVNLTGTKRGEDHPNRYVRSVAECLLADLTDEAYKEVTASAMPCLTDYLRQRPRRAEEGPVDSRFELVIFDQFEEICTLDPTDIPAKKAFFEELGEALRDRNRWALFVIREDHLAEVDAFSHLLPTALASRFRLNLLTIDQASDAIRGPAAAAGWPFSPEHVKRLAEDLATVTVLHPDGPADAVGITVEPVQLQVVCRRLWENRDEVETPSAQAIRTGAVDEALADFYDTALARIAQRQSTETAMDRERSMRDWIERYLIVKPGIRNQIMRGVEQTEDLPNDCVSALVSEYILRVDHRSGRDWIEITHDRMIAPIVKSNENWRKRYLHLYQQQAVLWQQNGRRADMLLSQHDYAAALSWQETRPGKPGADEAAFLEASRLALVEHARRIENSRRRRRRWWALGGCLTLCMCAWIHTSWLQEQKAMIEQLNGEALSLPPGHYAVTLDKALAAYELWQGLPSWMPWQSGSGHLLRNIHAALLAGLVSVPPVQQYRLVSATGGQGAAAVRQLAFHPVRRLLAAACADGTVALWNLDQPDRPLMRLQAIGQAWSVAFNEAGNLLAAGGNGGTRVWPVDAQGAVGTPFDQAAPSAVKAVAFGAGGMLAIAQADGDVSVLAAGQPGMAVQARFDGTGKGVGVTSAVTFMGPDKLAFSDWSGNIWVWPWRMAGGDTVAEGKTDVLTFFPRLPRLTVMQEGRAGIAELAYDAGSDQLAAAGWRKADTVDSGRSYIATWRDASTAPRRADNEGVTGRESIAHALAFAPDGATMAYTGGESRSLSFMASPVLAASASAPAPAQPVRFQERLFSIAYLPYPQDGGHWLAVGDGEKIALLDLKQAGPVPSRPLASTALFDGPSSRYLAAMSNDGSVMAVTAGPMLALTQPAGAKAADLGIGALNALAVAPRGDLVAAAGAASAPVLLLDRLGGKQGSIALDQCPGARGLVAQLAFQPSVRTGQMAVANGGALCVFDVSQPATPRLLWSFQSSGAGAIHALAYSADGASLAAVDGDNTLRVWRKRGLPEAFPAPVTRVTALTFMPDGQHLAFGTDDTDIWFLDLARKQWDRLDQLHDAAIASLQFGGTNGTKFMLSNDTEGRMMIWSRDRDGHYNRIGRPLSQRGPALPVALSGNGQLLLVGGATPRVYDLSMQVLLGLACVHVDGARHGACRAVR